jgi:hypothetical protein
MVNRFPNDLALVLQTLLEKAAALCLFGSITSHFNASHVGFKNRNDSGYTSFWRSQLNA